MNVMISRSLHLLSISSHFSPEWTFTDVSSDVSFVLFSQTSVSRVGPADEPSLWRTRGPLTHSGGISLTVYIHIQQVRAKQRVRFTHRYEIPRCHISNCCLLQPYSKGQDALITHVTWHEHHACVSVSIVGCCYCSFG